MKKIFTLCTALMCAVLTFGESYGILVNGKTYYAGTKTDEFEGFQQYLAHVQVNAGDYCQLYDADNQAAWAKPLNSASVAGFTYDEAAQRYNVTVAGCFDFYIKLKFGADELYVGEGKDCGAGTEISGGGQGGGENPGGGGVVEGNPRYYYKGNIDGEDVEPTDSRLFEHGVAEIEFSQKAALFVLYQVDGAQGVQYMTSAWSNEPVAQATLSVDGGGNYQKWNCPVGTTKLYLYDNGDGTLEISNKELPGKKLADPQPTQAIEKMVVTEKARKVIMDGQLRIVRGDKIYDATGREL